MLIIGKLNLNACLMTFTNVDQYLIRSIRNNTYQILIKSNINKTLGMCKKHKLNELVFFFLHGFKLHFYLYK